MKFTFPIVVLLFSPCVRAELKTVSFEAEITDMPDPFAGLKVGDTVTGKYTFDPEVKDENVLDPDVGDYFLKSPAFGMEINLNGNRLKTRSGATIQIEVVNNLPDFDSYNVASADNRYDGNGFVPGAMGFNLWDTTAKALNSDKLPSKGPVLSKYDYHNVVFVYGGSIDLSHFFYAEMRKLVDGDSLFVPLVEILPASGDFVTGQSIIPVIRIEAEDTSGIRIEKILLDDVDVTERYLTASRQGKLPEDHPGVVWQLLPPKPSPGMHVFKVKARLADGRKIWGQADWNILHAKMEKPDRPDGRTETKPNSDSKTRPD